MNFISHHINKVMIALRRVTRLNAVLVDHLALTQAKLVRKQDDVCSCVLHKDCHSLPC